jgi:hypothetical protein
MAKDDKIIRKLKQSKRNVKFSELDGFLKRQGFEVRQPRKGSSHYVYKRGEGDEKIRFTIVKPHGKKKTVDPAAVDEVLDKLELEEAEEQEDDDDKEQEDDDDEG